MLDFVENLIKDKQLLNKGEISDLKGSLLSIFLNYLTEKTGKKIVFVPLSKSKRDILKDDLNPPEFPSFSLTSTLLEPHIQTKTQYFEAFFRFFEKGEKIAIANPCFFLLPLPEITTLFFTIKEHIQLKPENLRKYLFETGYIETDIVKEQGAYSIRGNIVDFYPFNMEYPIRIETEFDEVESIKLFDPQTQRSLKIENEVTISPIYPLKITEGNIERIQHKLKTMFNKPSLKLSLKERTTQLEKGYLKDFFYLSLSLEKDRFYHLFKDTLFIIENKKNLYYKLASLKKEIERLYAKETKNGYLALPYNEVFRDLSELFDFMEKHSIEINPSHPFKSMVPPVIPGKTESICSLIRDRLSKKTKVYLSCQSQFTVKKAEEFLFENSIPYSKSKQESGVILVQSNLNHHFEIPGNLLFLNFLNLFPVKHRKMGKRRINTPFFSDLSDIKENDFVVHLDYGIGRYLGIKVLKIENSFNEMIEIEFANNTKVFVPVSKANLIQKYKDRNAENIPLSNISSQQWQRTKQKVKKEIEEYARELLTLYAERKMSKGIAFVPPSGLYREFEEAFEYTETEDQINAIKDINKDLEEDYPMDRLLCGDVGFGKTEVAMRACFRAVESGYQVLVLAPTTVLAFQHFERFKKRFEQFPIEIEMLSRFVSQKKQKNIIRAFSNGETDILIGTHRILSKDIVPKKLGLIVVDEEQRFGVIQKEKLKYLKKSVNVLSMTATPIPRTLNMSIMGLKDISIIETPPKNRLAVDTFHIPFDPETIKKAIEFELKRKGQIYFVHNRIETIDQIASIIKSIVPDAKTSVAHGKMGEDKLEKIMLKFFKKEIDILVCTTIIENGMDVKDANTMFINDAQNFGLSQLYQLRGRIGRSDKPAYCYLITPATFSLTKEAKKRIEALEEFSYLGAGFRISMLDLELRGAGELLGTKQSGHINSVGMELYAKMLEETVEKIKNRGYVEEETIIEHPFFIPTNYIDIPSTRLSFYRKMTMAREHSDLLKIVDEMEDRFGKLPEQIDLIILSHKLRIEARKIGIKSIALKKNRCTIIPSENHKINLENLIDAVNKNPLLSISPEGTMVFLKGKGEEVSNFIENIIHFFKKLKQN